ncbi:unnamed protein product [Paramecium octaurelia]|uniref:Uncharacterized protein n=1 Tax=Paramecium octaurelia TaxID=43137 RepID=A0A8S1SA66_PAROT|nr:unnamed protein product [Paramecium octaurelia]
MFSDPSTYQSFNQFILISFIINKKPFLALASYFPKFVKFIDTRYQHSKFLYLTYKCFKFLLKQNNIIPNDFINGTSRGLNFIKTHTKLSRDLVPWSWKSLFFRISNRTKVLVCRHFFPDILKIYLNTSLKT